MALKDKLAALKQKTAESVKNKYYEERGKIAIRREHRQEVKDIERHAKWNAEKRFAVERGEQKAKEGGFAGRVGKMVISELKKPSQTSVFRKSSQSQYVGRPPKYVKQQQRPFIQPMTMQDSRLGGGVFDAFHGAINEPHGRTNIERAFFGEQKVTGPKREVSTKSVAKKKKGIRITFD